MSFLGVRIPQAKGLFFDRQSVQSTVSRAERRVLSKFGAFVRQNSRQRIRRRKRASQPGEAPTNRTGRLKRYIYFVFDPQHRSVVIGPVLLERSTGAPATLEHGGITTITNRQRHPLQVDIAARPYMGPAFAQEQSRLPELWQNSVR